MFTQHLPLLGLICATAIPASAVPVVWINEIHYDNGGADTGEFVEIAGPAGTDLTGYVVHWYTGSNGNTYGSLALSGLLPDQSNGFGTLSFLFSGIQNGAPDGLALADGSGVLQFLSYEGEFTGASGPAAGLISLDIGVEESGSATGTSLGLIGSGSGYDDFVWALIDDDTPGAVNVGQSFVATASSNVPSVPGVPDSASTVFLLGPAILAMTAFVRRRSSRSLD